MKMLVAALVLVLGLALAASGRGETPSRGKAKSSESALSRWPKTWEVTPSDEIIREAEAAAKEFEVPVLLLFALGYVESRFDPKAKGKLHGGNTDRFRKSWNVYQNRTIPGGTVKDMPIRWGAKFKPQDWRPYGWLQVMPNAIWGVVIPASAPLEAGLDARNSARAGASYLRRFKKSPLGDGSWLYAIKAYNAKPEFRDAVIKQFTALGGKASELSESKS